MTMNEADTCRKFVVPKLQASGWDNEPHSINEQVTFTDGRIIVAGRKARRRPGKRADYVLRFRPDMPVAVVEAKPEFKTAGEGPHKTPTYLPPGVPGIPFVTVKNMVTGKLILEDLNYISEADHAIFTKRCRPEQGDVLYSKDGATRGCPCFVDTPDSFSIFVSVALIKPIRTVLDGRYLAHLLNSSWIKARVAEKSRGDMIAHIVLREIREFPVPLPDIPEQRSIVARLDSVHGRLLAAGEAQGAIWREINAALPAMLDRAFKGGL